MSDETMHVGFVYDVDSPGFSRRTILKTMAFAAAAGFLAACGGGSSSSSAEKLNFYNWTDYIADDTIPNFEHETGIKVTYDNYSSNDELFAKLRGGNPGFDLIVPTDATLVKMRRAGILDTIDLDKITNLDNLDPRFRTASYDPGNRYSIPWQWGTTGIGYDASKVTDTVDDWDALRLPVVKDRSSFLDESRDAFMMALIALGHDPNTLDDKQLDEATDYLVALKKNMKAITSDYQDPLKSGELIMAQAYSGDVFQISADNKNVRYIIPKSGAFTWVDSMAIPKDAPHKADAERFMNYILEPKVGAALTNFVRYGSPNQAAQPFIDPSITSNPLIYPPADVLARLPFQKDLGEQEIKYADRWTKVKTA